MNRTLIWRGIAIVVVILLCIYGIIGLPKSKGDKSDRSHVVL